MTERALPFAASLLIAIWIGMEAGQLSGLWYLGAVVGILTAGACVSFAYRHIEGISPGIQGFLFGALTGVAWYHIITMAGHDDGQEFGGIAFGIIFFLLTWVMVRRIKKQLAEQAQNLR